MPKGAVAVLIAAYAAKDTIAAAVRSALHDNEVAEVIVVDDASPDATAAAARSGDDGSGRLTVIAQAHNIGPSAARNLAIAASSAPYLAILDADDLLLPGRFARLLVHEGWDFIADNVAFVSTVDGADLLSRNTPLGSATRRLSLEEFIARNISRRGRSHSEYGFLKPLISRAWLDAQGLRYDEAVRLGEDYLFYAQALAGGARFLLAEACGYVAVERATSLSRRHGAQELDALLKAARTLASGASLSPRLRRLLHRHARSIEVKLHHRRLLDCKADAGLVRASAELLRTPGMIAPVGWAVLADKLRWGHSVEPPLRLLFPPEDFAAGGD